MAPPIEVPENIKLFNYDTAYAIARLYESYPEPTRLGRFPTSVEIPDDSLPISELPEDEQYDESQKRIRLQQQDLKDRKREAATLNALEREHLVRFENGEEYARGLTDVVLTFEGMKILREPSGVAGATSDGSPPTTGAEELGAVISEAITDGATSFGKALLKQLVDTLIDRALGRA